MEKDYSFLKVFLEEPLFIIEQEEEKQKSAFPASIEFIGENKKRILVLAEHARQTAFTKSEEFELLLKILHAVKLSQHEVAILPYASTSAPDFAEVLAASEPQTIISLAQNHLIPPSIPMNTPTVRKGINYLASTSLSVLAKNVEEKKALWSALRGFF